LPTTGRPASDRYLVESARSGAVVDADLVSEAGEDAGAVDGRDVVGLGREGLEAG
jgi:hypothetical protein